MADHWAKFTVPSRELGKTDVSFDVYADGKRLGELRVSRGAVVWYGKSKKKPQKLNWSRFAQLMEDQGGPSNERR